MQVAKTMFVERNPSVVLHDGSEAGATIFDPQLGSGYTLNRVGEFVWRHLDGYHSTTDILEGLIATFELVPQDAGAHLEELIDSLIERGFAGYVLHQ